MSDDRKPSEDLKEGFGLLFRAAKNWGRGLTPEKIEAGFETGAREVVKAVTTVGKAVSTELEKMVEPSTPIPPGEPVPTPTQGSDAPSTGTSQAPKVRVETSDGEKKATLRRSPHARQRVDAGRRAVAGPPASALRA